MNYEDLSREELLAELTALRQRVEEYELRQGHPSNHGLGDQEDHLRKTSDRDEAPLSPGPLEDPGAQEDYRSVVQSASEAICITQDGRLKFANRASPQLTGYSGEELLSMAFAALVHPEDLQEVVRIYVMRMQGEYVIPGQRFRILAKTGTVKWVESWSATIAWHERPAVLSMIREVTKQVHEEERRRIAHDELDRSVQKRTRELQAINDRLMREIGERRRAESVLRSSEERFRTLIETMNEAFGTQDENGLITYVNSKQCEMLGYSRDELIGRRFAEFFDQESRLILIDQLGKRKEGQAGSYEVTFVRKDGERVSAIISGSPVFDQAGNFKGSFGVGTDITGLKRAEQAIRESEEKFRLIVEGAPEAVFVQTGGMFAYLNQQALELFKADSEGDLLGKPVMDCFHPRFHEAIRERIRLLNVEKKAVPSSEQIYLRMDGAEVNVEVSAVPICFQGQDGALVFARDITERKQAEIELRKARHEWEEIFQAIGHPTIIMDLEHRIVSANKAAIKASGKSLHELVDAKCYNLFHKSNKPPRGCPMEALLKSGSLETVEMEMEALGGYYLVSCSPFLDAEGKIQGVIHIATDITERKKTEEAARVERRRFEALAENSPFGLVMIDDEGVFRYVNPKFQEMFGYESKDVPNGEEWFRKAYPESEYRHQVIAAWLEDIASSGLGEQRPRVFTVTCKDGRKKIVHFRPVQLQPGEHLMTCEDITDRVYAERALSEHAAMLENILDKAADGICVCHNTEVFPYVRFTHWNPRMSEITGYTMVEINQSGWYQTIYPDAGIRQAAIDRMARMRLGDDIRAEEWVITTKDGTEKSLSISTSVIKEEDGKSHVLAILQDITDRRMKEKALLESEERFRLTFQTSPDSININRLSDGLYLDVNDGFLANTGYSREEVIGKSSLELDIWNNPQDRQRLVESLREKGYVPNLEARFRFKDGTVHTCLMSARVIMLKGGPHIVSITRDIEDWRRTQEALRASEQRYRSLFEESIDGVYLCSERRSDNRR